jgi:hypothetical protein
MKYTPTNDTNLTSKLCHLLDDEAIFMLRGITPRKMTLAFGVKEVDHYECERGYTDPEWYFKPEREGVVGIGFRWGVARFRGKCVDEVAASRFIKYVHSMINITLSKAPEDAKEAARAKLFNL